MDMYLARINPAAVGAYIGRLTDLLGRFHLADTTGTERQGNNGTDTQFPAVDQARAQIFHIPGNSHVIALGHIIHIYDFLKINAPVHVMNRPGVIAAHIEHGKFQLSVDTNLALHHTDVGNFNIAVFFNDLVNIRAHIRNIEVVIQGDLCKCTSFKLIGPDALF